MNKPRHLRTCDIQKSLETRERFPIAYFDSRTYIQHNVGLEDGLGPILTLMDALPVDRTKVTPLRSFEDGDYSVAHLDYLLGDWGPMVGFEIHRWENDRIVEHWDNLQSTPAAPNASGRTMIDGSMDITDIDRTDANKALVRAYVDSVLILGEFAKVAAFHHGSTLIQHDPAVPDGTEALIAHLAAARAGRKGPIYQRTHMLLGQGNFVLVVSEGEQNDDVGASKPVAFYDLYRVASNAITEHWNVVEIIPPPEQWKNSNGKF